MLMLHAAPGALVGEAAAKIAATALRVCIVRSFIFCLLFYFQQEWVPTEIIASKSQGWHKTSNPSSTPPGVVQIE
jgi:hypothetical protein